MENQPTKNLLTRLIGWGLFQQAVLVILLFVPGTWHYWQGWTFFGMNLMLMMVFCTYFYKHDRELLARRLLRREKVIAQRFIMFLMKIVSVVFYVLCGLDNRLGWSLTYLTPMPWWLTVLALLGYAGCYFLFIPVFKANRFAASVIQTEAGQTVADQGPYRWCGIPCMSSRSPCGSGCRWRWVHLSRCPWPRSWCRLLFCGCSTRKRFCNAICPAMRILPAHSLPAHPICVVIAGRMSRLQPGQFGRRTIGTEKILLAPSLGDDAGLLRTAFEMVGQRAGHGKIHALNSITICS